MFGLGLPEKRSPDGERRVIARRIFLGMLGAVPLAAGCSPNAASGGGIIAIIMPPYDNPFFRAQAVAARDRAVALGYEPLMLVRSEEHTSELQSLMRISYAVFCLKKKKQKITTISHT